MEPARGLELANLRIRGLNMLWADCKPQRLAASIFRPATEAQRGVQHHIVGRAARFVKSVAEVAQGRFDAENGLQPFDTCASLISEPLRGGAVDLPTLAGTCDVLEHCSADMRRFLTDASLMFPAGPFPEGGSATHEF